MFREACQKATLKLLEPMMKVEVVTPEEFMGDVIGDLNGRRGQVGSTEPRNATAINAVVPLANMFGYINNLNRQHKDEHNTRCNLVIMIKCAKCARRSNKKISLILWKIKILEYI